MSVEEFLRGRGGLDGTSARLAFQDRWLVFSGFGNHWVVYQRKIRSQKTRVLFAGGPDEALKVLEQGFRKKVANKRVEEEPKACTEQPDETVGALQGALQASG
jgi:hypothetical protein